MYIYKVIMKPSVIGGLVFQGILRPRSMSIKWNWWIWTRRTSSLKLTDSPYPGLKKHILFFVKCTDIYGAFDIQSNMHLCLISLPHFVQILKSTTH